MRGSSAAPNSQECNPADDSRGSAANPRQRRSLRPAARHHNDVAQKGLTEFGIPVLAECPMHNISSSPMFSGVLKMTFDEATQLHSAVDEPEAADAPRVTLTADEVEGRALAAIRRL